MGRCFAARIFLVLWPVVVGFKVLDVGAPRTGTQSMYSAMRILGLNPLHTGLDLKIRPALCNYLFGNGSLDDALGIFDAFDGAMDEPVMLMYEEVMAAFPEAKFLLTISAPESWFKTYVDLITTSHIETTGYPKPAAECTAMASWGCIFDGSSTEAQKHTCLQNYERHIQRVQDMIPPQRLLVYNWSDGWTPLCHFLGLPIPEEDFPHDDFAIEHFQQRNRWLHGQG